MSEVWKDIVGYVGKYQVSNLGRVRSTNYRNTGLVKIMTPLDNGNGYYFVGLRDGSGGNKKCHYVHRLVASAFLDNPLGLPQVNHLDHDRSNNSVENLEWCSVSDNLMHGSTHSRTIETQRKTHPRRKTVYQYDLDGNLIKVYGSQKEAERETGILAPDICMCCNGKYKTTGGFVFSSDCILQPVVSVVM